MEWIVTARSDDTRAIRAKES
ncbi:MAG: hypothetical protein ACXWCZ_03375, partial [Flavisolibacter sp.]